MAWLLSGRRERSASLARPRAAAAPGSRAPGELASVNHRIPRYVHFVEEFPMTVTGKVRKVQMREEAADLLR
ncbi:hypothetical protein [Aeromicrobium wangtongii]|uniref:hypothetical protein n=1 Tax=Aeromicrobium wangtongii TaxID=2969247 RepID=UPI0020177E64|nr:hypothetical protein [Aeromicrobium wangtongii]MCL3819319.1 hypothetical protein [Aeromicrobium wangtongii]